VYVLNTVDAFDACYHGCKF